MNLKEEYELRKKIRAIIEDLDVMLDNAHDDFDWDFDSRSIDFAVNDIFNLVKKQE